MKDYVVAFFTIFVLVTLVIGVYKIESYRWDDCIRVGHGKFYCFLNMGK